MSDFERGSWTTLAVVMAALALILLATGSDDWLDGLCIAALMAYIAILGKRTSRKGGRA